MCIELRSSLVKEIFLTLFKFCKLAISLSVTNRKNPLIYPSVLLSFQKDNL